MARKTLLTETQIRKFMKLARLDAVGESRIKELSSFTERSEEDELEDELHATEDELGAEDHVADMEGGELDDLEGDDLDTLDDEEALGGGELDAELEDMLAQGVEALAAAWGIEDRVDVEGGAEGGEEELGEPLPGDELGGEDELDVTDMAVDVEPGGGEEIAVDDEEEEIPGMRGYQEGQIVQEVARRVVARLAQEKRKESLSDELAERILQRLTNK